MTVPGRSQLNSVERQKPKNISLLSFNARGLLSSILELEQCALEYQLVDIILVQETFLKPKNPTCCKIKNRIQLQTDIQGAPKGETALYHRHTLSCSPLDIPPLIDLVAIGCRLSMSGYSTIIIISVYLPSRKELLRSDIVTLLALGDAVILFGDLNSKSTQWRCNYTNANERKMIDLAKDLHFDVIASSTHTYFTNNIRHRPDILDIALTNEIDYAIGALINHIATVVENSSRAVPAADSRQKLPEDVRVMLRAKNVAIRRASAYPTYENSKHKKKFTVPYNAPTLRIDDAPIPWQHNYKYLEVTLDKHLHFRDHVARNKFCRQATDAYWCDKISELPTINKYMKDVSKRFFDMAQSHSNPLIASAVSSISPKVFCPS
ncbi:RNA-directed DNA polymerase from mobile element jockey [Eumeta japonica]|uniref:RNA-directed DNA polymerase from mobile element jockey n=1 Tax=Eumeta variegata TaxID=151549 RepID=A0A4C1VET8_EUMVA|nr:RNA-directed DNA polymerase from mobile element jockey [Eumeta japonica]